MFDLSRARMGVCVVAAVVCSAPLALAAHADAYIYWTHGLGGTGTIARAELNGSGINLGFINTSFARHVAVDATQIYWANDDTNSIGSADIDGSDAYTNFITGASVPYGIAVKADHIYWTNTGTTTIGRANINGSGVDQNFIDPAKPVDVAVDAHHLYWTDNSSGTVARADLAGANVEPNFITGADNPGGLTVGGGHIYWANASANTIGRARIDGSKVDQNFIGGANEPNDLAVDANHIYWTNGGNGEVTSIGRARIGGSKVNQNFIGGLLGPVGIAVDGPPDTRIIKGAPSKTKRTNLKLTFTSSEPGSTFECKLDKGPYEQCISPIKLKGLKKGEHAFKVRAIDPADNVDPSPAKDRFKVVR